MSRGRNEFISHCLGQREIGLCYICTYELVFFFRDSYGVLGWAGALSNGSEAEAKDLGVSVSLEKFESRKVEVRAVCASPGTYLVGSAFAVFTCQENDQHSMAHCINNTSLLIVQQS